LSRRQSVLSQRSPPSPKSAASSSSWGVFNLRGSRGDAAGLQALPHEAPAASATLRAGLAAARFAAHPDSQHQHQQLRRAAPLRAKPAGVAELAVDLEGCGLSGRLTEMQAAPAGTGSLLGAATLLLPSHSLSPRRLRALTRGAQSREAELLHLLGATLGTTESTEIKGGPEDDGEGSPGGGAGGESGKGRVDEGSKAAARFRKLRDGPAGGQGQAEPLTSGEPRSPARRPRRPRPL